MKNEPVAIPGAIVAVVSAALIKFGSALGPELIAAIVLLVSALAITYSRSKVTPVAKLKAGQK